MGLAAAIAGFQRSKQGGSQPTCQFTGGCEMGLPRGLVGTDRAHTATRIGLLGCWVWGLGSGSLAAGRYTHERGMM